MSSDSDSDDYYGPALPPGFKKSGVDEPTKTIDKVLTKPDQVQIGPVIPPSLRAKLEANLSEDQSSFVADDKSAVGGDDQSADEKQESDSESDSDVIGPLPPDHPKAQQRSMSASSTSTSESKKPKREEWMLVPPKNKIIPGLGLGPRKFLTRTPMDSKQSDEEEDEDEAFAREADAEIERNLIQEYDSKMDEMKKDFEAKKRRGESLLEIHQKELKKKKDDKSGEKAERKPFDRDTDLSISGMSSADKKKYIEKSKELNTKFSRGSRKYL